MSGVIDHVNLTCKLDALLLSALDYRSAQDPTLFDISTVLGNGTGAGQASQVWADQRTLTPSSNENIDLAGSLTNAFGVTLTFTKIRLFIVRALSTNTNNVNVIRASSNGVVLFNAASGGVSLAPSDFIVYGSPSVGVTVTAATGDLFNIANSAGGTSVTYDIIIVGTD